VSASKNVTPASRVGVDAALQRASAKPWGSVADNRKTAAEHRKPKTVKLPSGRTVKR
jgi:hypothetical protein